MHQLQFSQSSFYSFSIIVARTKPLPVEEVLKIFCMLKIIILWTYRGPAMFLLYHSDGCNTSETVFHWCYVNDLHTTRAVVCWVTACSHHVAAPRRQPSKPTSLSRGIAAHCWQPPKTVVSSIAPCPVDSEENDEYEQRTDIRTTSSIQTDRDEIIYDHQNKNLQHESCVKRCAKATHERKF